MQEIYSSNSHVVTGICDPNKSRARNHRNYLAVITTGMNEYSNKTKNWGLVKAEAATGEVL